MAYTSVEFECICPFCNEVVITNRNAYISDMGDDIWYYVIEEYCTACNAGMAFSKTMDVAKVSIPVRDNFGASIF